MHHMTAGTRDWPRTLVLPANLVHARSPEEQRPDDRHIGHWLRAAFLVNDNWRRMYRRHAGRLL